MSFLKKKSLNVVILILAVFLILVPSFILPVCPVMKDGYKMSCYYSKFFCMAIGGIILVSSFISIVVNNKIFIIILSIVNIVGGLLVHLVPNKIVKISVGLDKMGRSKFMGYCMKSTMNCVKNHTFLVTSILGILIFILSLGFVIYLLVKKEN